MGVLSLIATLCLATACVAPAPAPAPDPFAEYLSAPFTPADGFDFPVGNAQGAGFRLTTAFGESYELGIHPGEDWNGIRGGNSDYGDPVYAIGAGRVVEAGQFADPWGGMVVLEHLVYDGADKRIVRSVYAHLSEVAVAPGVEVARRQRIGAIGRDPGKRYFAHLHLELRTDASLPPTYWPSSNGDDIDDVRARYLSPSDFIRGRRRLFPPQREPYVILVDQATFKMRVVRGGVSSEDREIGLGQGEGPKEVRGDLKTPRGAYFVTLKSRGPFGGDYAEFYGGYWIKVNYPGPLDAERGVAAGLLTEKQRAAIVEQWQARTPTDPRTVLGGGIGFHGWAGKWEGPSARLSWGCVVMHEKDLEALYDEIPLGALVIIR
jgi:murein DD-endopeptidase MepM/ murein hydrolase activator NlpD